MTASLQTYAREHMEAIDNLSFEFSILTMPPEDIIDAPKDGVIVFGMYLEVRPSCLAVHTISIDFTIQTSADFIYTALYLYIFTVTLSYRTHCWCLNCHFN